VNFFSKLKLLLTHDKLSQEYQSTYAELINKSLENSTILYLKKCFSIDFSSTILTKEKLEYLLSLFKLDFDKISQASNIILVFGRTGSGKSSLISNLCDVKLHLVNEAQDEELGSSYVKVAFSDDNTLTDRVRIGNTSVEETVFPAIIKFKNLTFIEIPCLNDKSFDEDQREFTEWGIRMALLRSKNVLASFFAISYSALSLGHGFQLNDLINPAKHIPQQFPILFIVTKASINNDGKIYTKQKRFLNHIAEIIKYNSENYQKRDVFLKKMSEEIDIKKAIITELEKLPTSFNPLDNYKIGRDFYDKRNDFISDEMKLLKEAKLSSKCIKEVEKDINYVLSFPTNSILESDDRTYQTIRTNWLDLKNSVFKDACENLDVFKMNILAHQILSTANESTTFVIDYDKGEDSLDHKTRLLEYIKKIEPIKTVKLSFFSATSISQSHENDEKATNSLKIKS
jgi:energy-coupling factor transporter ATP-binding protein EcfA2